MATGQNRHHAVSRVVKVLKYGRDCAIIPPGNMVETVVVGVLLKKIGCVKWNLVQVGSAEPALQR
jgi:hypothetical protein